MYLNILAFVFVSISAWYIEWLKIDGLVQEKHNYSALAMKLRLCTKPSKLLHVMGLSLQIDIASDKTYLRFLTNHKNHFFF